MNKIENSGWEYKSSIPQARHGFLSLDSLLPTFNKKNMRIIFKNLLNTLKRFKLATIFNILGLSVALAAFTIIMIQVDYERSFDTMYSTSDRIFRVTTPEDEGVFSIIQSRPFIEEIIKSSPHIECGTVINPFIGEIYFSITDRVDKTGFKHEVVTCSPAITRVFDFQFVEGDKDCLKSPEAIIIPQSLARKLYGTESAIGELIQSGERIWSKDRFDFVVGGVYCDLSQNTQLRNAIYTAMDVDFAMNQWFANNYLCYLLLDDKVSAQNVTDNFNKNFDYSKITPEGYAAKKEGITLTPLSDIYFLDETQDGNLVKSGNREMMRVIISIAILIIIIASINFMNFEASLAPVRIKNINTQKVLGCSNLMLRITLVTEAILITFFSFLLSIIYIWIFHKTHLLSFIEASLSPADNWVVIGLCGIISLIIGLLIGLYPAFYMTSFSPVLALAGRFGLSPSGRKLRTVLIGFQFVVSIGLIIAASFIWLQNMYMRSYSLGFDKDQIAVVELNSTFYKDHKEEYVEKLKTNPAIADVAFSLQKLGGQDSYSTTSAIYKEQDINYFMLAVSWNFFEVMGIPVLGGRAPETTDEERNLSSLFFNKGAQRKYNLVLNDQFESFGLTMRIQGIVGDAKFTSLRQEEDNMAFLITNEFNLPISYIRLNAGNDHSEAIDYIRKTIAQLDPSYPVKIEFYDDLYNQLYHREKVLSEMVTVLCILAILISVVGVFGLVIFETEYKKREIGIRKVFGATIESILLLFNRLYIRIVLVCFILAVPISYYSISRWLESFHYKVPVYWWVFIVSGTLVFALVISIVSFQSWRAANANPVDSIKNE